MSFEIRPHPAFSWSHSRDTTFSDCTRKYYWQYYGSHNGWLAVPEGTEEARRAYTLKNLTNLHLSAGTAIHECARDCVLAIRAQSPPLSYGQMRTRVLGVLRHVCRCSKDRWSYLRDPKNHPMLHSMWYHGRFDAVEVEAVRAKVERCLYHLSESRIWREMPWYSPEEIAVIDHLESITIDSITLYAAPDLVVVCNDDVEVVDWKTGKDEEVVRSRVGLYAYYVSRKLGIPFRDGHWWGRVIRLFEGADERFPVTRRDLLRAEERMRNSVGYMQALLEDAAANQPRPRSAFPLAHPSQRWRCPHCNFLQLCASDIREQRALGAPQAAEV